MAIISRAILVTVVVEALCKRAAPRMTTPSRNDLLIASTRSSAIGLRPDFLVLRQARQDAFSDQGPLVGAKNREHLEHHRPAGRAGVEPLGVDVEIDPLGLDVAEEAHEVRQAAAEPTDRPSRDEIEVLAGAPFEQGVATGTGGRGDRLLSPHPPVSRTAGPFLSMRAIWRQAQSHAAHSGAHAVGAYPADRSATSSSVTL